MSSIACLLSSVGYSASVGGLRQSLPSMNTSKLHGGSNQSVLFRARKAPLRVAGAHGNVDESRFAEVQESIANLYDVGSPVWEDVCGEHLHHGFYDLGLAVTATLFANINDTQVRTIEESLNWAGIPDEGNARPRRILDVGCGIGGGSRLLARKYGAQVIGITLSPLQAQRATQLTSAASLSHQVSYQVADALNQPFPDEHFDFVWCMEVAEHMPDKEKFMSELVRITMPGGRILIITCCHRELLPNETILKPSEQKLLDNITDAFHLPVWCAASEYVNLAQAMGLQDIKSADWSEHIKPFWPAVLAALLLNVKGMFGVIKSGWTVIKGAFAMAYLIQAINSGLMKFAVITARKQG